jgi:uncharacterized tellurite resistance protein B-like protein
MADDIAETLHPIIHQLGEYDAMMASLAAGLITTDQLAKVDLKTLVLMHENTYGEIKDQLGELCLENAESIAGLRTVISDATGDLRTAAFDRALSIELPFNQCWWLLQVAWTSELQAKALTKANESAVSFEDCCYLFNHATTSADQESAMGKCEAAITSVAESLWVINKSRGVYQREQVVKKAIELAKQLSLADRVKAVKQLWASVNCDPDFNFILEFGLSNAREFEDALWVCEVAVDDMLSQAVSKAFSLAKNLSQSQRFAAGQQLWEYADDDTRLQILKFCLDHVSSYAQALFVYSHLGDNTPLKLQVLEQALKLDLRLSEMVWLERALPPGPIKQAARAKLAKQLMDEYDNEDDDALAFDEAPREVTRHGVDA